MRILIVVLSVALLAPSVATAQSNTCPAWEARYKRMKDRADAFETRYQRMKRQADAFEGRYNRLRQQGTDCPASGGASSANAKAAISDADGKLRLAICETPGLICQSTMQLQPPNPPSDSEETAWLESILVVQRTAVESLIGPGQFAQVEAEEVSTCGGQLYCKAAFRQQVIRALVK